MIWVTKIVTIEENILKNYETNEGIIMTNLNEIIDDLRSANTDEIVNVVAREHRTNQQLLARNVFEILKHWSDDYEKGNYDARNEATVRLANEMVSGSELSQGKIYLPYI
jgi:hypothetical protein